MSERVAVIHNLPSPYRLPLFAELARRFELRVFFLAEGAPNRNWRPPASTPFDASWLRGWSIRLPGQEHRALHLNPGALVALWRWRPGAVIIGGYDSLTSFLALFYCILTGTPAILWSGSTARESAGRSWLKERIKRFFVRRCRAYAAYGTRARDYLVALGARPERIALAWNTVDTAWFASAAGALDRERERGRLGLADLPAVLFAAQLIDRKDPLLLVQALALLRNEGVAARLVVAGGGPLEGAVRQAAADAGVPAVFAGLLSTEQMPPVYVAADLLVLPSREEIWGLVANEAMACGTAVVISDACGAAADLVLDGETGLVTPPGDAAALAAAIRSLLASGALRHRLAAAGRTHAREFSIERAADGLSDAVRIATGRGR